MQSKSASLAQNFGLLDGQHWQGLNREGFLGPSLLDPSPPPESGPLFTKPSEHGHWPLHLTCKGLCDYYHIKHFFILSIPICHCILPCSHLNKYCCQFHKQGCTPLGRYTLCKGMFHCTLPVERNIMLLKLFRFFKIISWLLTDSPLQVASHLLV